MNKEMIDKLNDIAQENYETAAAMLRGINMVLGTKYGWLNKRVVFFEGDIAHDAWANAEE